RWRAFAALKRRVRCEFQGGHAGPAACRGHRQGGQARVQHARSRRAAASAPPPCRGDDTRTGILPPGPATLAASLYTLRKVVIGPFASLDHLADEDRGRMMSPLPNCWRGRTLNRGA